MVSGKTITTKPEIAGSNSIEINFFLLENFSKSFIPKLTAIEFFTVCTKLAEMALFYSKELTAVRKGYLGYLHKIN